MSECVFCKIVNGQIPAKIVAETENAIAFHDIKPATPVHLIIVPKKHIETVNDVTSEDSQILGELFYCAKLAAEKTGVASNGYRLVVNCGKDAGQEVMHIHMHLLGGRKFGWPPG